MSGELDHDDPERPVRDWLPIIDRLMVEMSVPLGQRPFRAAVVFVEECITALHGDTREEFWRRDWFAALYRVIDAWYMERYGDALASAGGKVECSLVVVYGLPFRVTIPLKIIEPNVPGESFWLVYPNSVLPDEDMVSWLDKPPNLERLSLEESEDLKQQITKTGGLIRSIHVNVLTAELRGGPLRGLAGTISSHLSKAVEDILSQKRERVSIAAWETHLAVEKAVKLYLLQREVPVPRSHDLVMLRRLAEGNGAPGGADHLFAVLPSSTEAIKSRYGEGRGTRLDETIGIYKATLEIVHVYTEALRRRVVMNNARFQIRIPAWRKQT